MSRVIDVLKWGTTLGSGEQNFLGARWVTTVLRHAPDAKKRAYALKLLSLSPHYFLDSNDPKYDALSESEYLEASFANICASREKIYDQILKGRIGMDDCIIDYGCGPGFLATVLAKHVRKVYGCDISSGAIACAEVLNGAENIKYIVSDERGLNGIEDETVDAAISFAMAQHLSDEILQNVVAACHRKLKPGGKLIFQIQLADDLWKTETDWRRDSSLRGKLKYRYGLHCFGRSEKAHSVLFANLGFTSIRIEKISEIVKDKFDDICSQSLLTARKR